MYTISNGHFVEMSRGGENEHHVQGVTAESCHEARGTVRFAKYIHQDDRQWVQRLDPCIRFWRGETYDLEHGRTLIRVGGHFPGFQVLHSAGAEQAQGALFTGDQPQGCPDRRYVSLMYSYPNFIPLDAASVRRIVAAVEPFPFARLHGAWRNFVVQGNAKGPIHRSAERYEALEHNRSLRHV